MLSMAWPGVSPGLLLLLYVAIFFRGAGRCSVDKKSGKEF
jgi:hypothetical protein